MKNAKKIVGRFFTTIKAQEMFHSFKDKNEKLNFKPDSMFDLQKLNLYPKW